MRRIFYGWVITGLSTLANTLAWSVRATFALFYVALLQEFGWGRAETAFGYSLSALLLAGRLNDRLGPQVLVSVGGLLLAAGLALTVATRRSGTTTWRLVSSRRPVLRAS